MFSIICMVGRERFERSTIALKDLLSKYLFNKNSALHPANFL